MLTPRQNLLETIHGGHPDRFVNQYDFCQYLRNPVIAHSGNPRPGQMHVVNSWGVTRSWAPGQPGSFPDQTPETIVIKDIEHWRDYVKAPTLDWPQEEWDKWIEQAEAVDRNEYFVCMQQHPGIFEQCHHLGEIKNVLIYLYENPDEMHELIKFLADWELQLAELCVEKIHPDALFHHDDWGTQIFTFMSPDMFAELCLEPYKEVDGYWKKNGVELIIHHSDSFAQTLVPYMVEMGIDIWQGVMDTNDINKIEEEWGGKLTCMGGINSAYVDYEGATYEEVYAAVKTAIDKYGNDGKYFIPCNTQGAPGMSIFPGVYDMVSKAIDEYGAIYFKEHGLA